MKPRAAAAARWPPRQIRRQAAGGGRQGDTAAGGKATRRRAARQHSGGRHRDRWARVASTRLFADQVLRRDDHIVKVQHRGGGGPHPTLVLDPLAETKAFHLLLHKEERKTLCARPAGPGVDEEHIAEIGVVDAAWREGSLQDPPTSVSTKSWLIKRDEVCQALSSLPHRAAPALSAQPDRTAPAPTRLAAPHRASTRDPPFVIHIFWPFST